MNPFENEEIIYEPNNINLELWVENAGRRINTYLSGWNISEDELKEHLKIIKKKKGCNGSVKQNEQNNMIFHLQGDHKVFLISYLKLLGIENIKLKIT